MTTCDPNDPNERFDGAAWAAKLPPEAQKQFCAAALEYAVCCVVFFRPGGTHDPVSERIMYASWQATHAAMFGRVRAMLPADAFDRANGSPRLPSLLGRVCMSCGGIDGKPPLVGFSAAFETFCEACANPGAA